MSEQGRLDLGLNPSNVLLDNSEGVFETFAHRHRLGRESGLKERDALQESGLISLKVGESFGGGSVHNNDHNGETKGNVQIYF